MLVSSSQDQWLFTREELEKCSPSFAQQVPPEKERSERSKGVNFIISCGMSLKDIAATALFLATKVEESGRKLKDIILVVARKAAKNEHLVIDENKREYWKWEDTIIYNEEVMLEALCFDMTVEHPYKPLLQFVQQIGGTKQLAQTAWAFVNDSLRLTLCLRHSSEVIAAASIYIALKFLDEEHHVKEHWCQTLDIGFDDIEACATEILQIYQDASVAK